MKNIENITTLAPTTSTSSIADDFVTGFERLLATWNHHQQLRSGGASLSELYASRAELDAVRLGTHKLAIAR